MADIDDRWYRKGANGKQVRTDRYGTGSRWVVRWRDPGGAQRKKSFRLKADAEDFAGSVRQDLRTGSYIAPDAGKVLGEEWARRWLAAQGHLKESTRERTRGVVENYVIPRWGRTPLAAVTYADVQTWVTQLGREGSSPRSVAKIHGVLRQLLDWAVKDGRLARNPAIGVPMPRPALTAHRYLDHSEVAMLAKECGDYSPLVRFLSYTGLRWGEAAALRVGSVDLTRRRVAVVASVTEVNGHLVWGSPKTHARRTVPLPRFVAQAIAPAVEDQDADALVFPAPRGGVLRVRNFRRGVFDAAVSRVGPTGLHPHELRHTAASLAIASGADVKVVQMMLGHKTATMTLDLYGHLFPDRLDDLADRMDSAACAPDVPHDADGGDDGTGSPR
ncbi:MAG: integrase [Pseudonocardia sp. SCN 72-86]|nr:MAG: integrase [Pseudonocardia sp. SCN 72-86]